MEQYGVTTRSGKTRTSPRGNDDRTDATYSNGGSTESASREASHPRDVTNDEQSTRAHGDSSNTADTSKKSCDKQLQLEARRRLQVLELREIRAAKAFAKIDRTLGQLHDDEKCLDTCYETVKALMDRSRITFEFQAADGTAGDKGAQTSEYVRAPSNEKENLTQALTDATVYRDTQCYFTESQNVARLRKALKGDARENVKPLLYSGAKADDILDSLQRCFGRPEATNATATRHASDIDSDNENSGRKPGVETAAIVTNDERRRTVDKNHKKSCPICKREHYLKDCETFKALPIDERWERAKKTHVCFRCLSNTHYRSECRAQPYGKDGCKKIHHKLLHQDRTPVDETNGRISSINVLHKKGRVFLKIIPVEISGPLNRFETYTLLNEGLTTTLIERDVALKIAPPGKRETLRIEGVGGKRLDYDKSFRLKVKIKGNFERNIEIMNALVIDKLQLAPQTIDFDTVRQYSYLHELEDKLSYEKARPILIGQDNWHLIVSHEVVQKNRDQPAASYTKLGWVLHGRENGIARPVHVINYIAREPSAEDKIDKLIKENFSKIMFRNRGKETIEQSKAKGVKSIGQY
ncbi:hypothetical protein EVAR_72714_1 [Eumeta japonica]|uniref:Peptidase aspartic putative domain-containing protein n=1 Tax=Eumeta variegata TaxID=151549 RepID=A0A4C1SJI9_EUMVA|nr:hypothetical protein EVAR_72714_1 [Eumeta japonica]